MIPASTPDLPREEVPTSQDPHASDSSQPTVQPDRPSAPHASPPSGDVRVAPLAIDFGSESVQPVLDSLLHLLPTSVSLHDSSGRVVLADQAAAICHFLSRPPDGVDLPDHCRDSCTRLAQEAAATGHRIIGTCTAGITLAAEPLAARGGGSSGLGVLVAAVGDYPHGEEHWLAIAETFGRPASKVLEAVQFTQRHGLREWEAVERLEVAASVLTRVLTTATRARPELPAAPRSPASVPSNPDVVLPALRAAVAATSDEQVLSGVARQLGVLHAGPSAWALLCRPGDVRGPLLLDAPPGLDPARWTDGHPALLAAHSAESAWHERDLSGWPDREALVEAGIDSVVVAPVRLAKHVEGLILVGLSQADVGRGALVAACADDLALVAAAHLGGARALADQRRQVRELRALRDVCAKAHASLDVGEVVEAVVDAFIAALGYTRSAVFLHDGETGRVRGVAARGHAGLDRARLIEGRLSSFPAAVEASRQDRAVFVAANADGVPEEYRRLFGVTAFVVVPLVAHGEALGFVALDRGGVDFSPALGELELATSLAQPAALALSHARLHAARLAEAISRGQSLSGDAALQHAGLPALAALAQEVPAKVTVTRRRDGVRITVDLPLPRAGTPAAEELSAHLKASGAALPRILVVDDDDENRRPLLALLQSWGHDAVGAGSGEAALRALVESRFDLVITDLAMPDIDGWAVARRVHDLVDPPSVVVLSGFAVDADATTLEARHVAEVLEKPASPSLIRDVVRRHARPAEC